MPSTIQKWGNSLGLRIPKALAEQVHLVAGSEVDIEADHGTLRVRPARRRKYRLADLLSQAKGPNPHGEWDTSGPAGRETI